MANHDSSCLSLDFSKFQRLFRCCRIKLRILSTVKLVALFDITLSISWIIQLARIFPKYWTIPNNHYTENASVLQTFWGCYLVKSVATIFLAILLFNAAVTSNIRKCKLWIFMITVVFLNCIVVSIVHVAIYYEGNRTGLIIFIILVTGMYRPYSIMIVWKFMKSLRLISRSRSFERDLKDQEVEMFFKGNPLYLPSRRGSFLDVQKAEHGPFNMSFEISKDSLHIDEENPLNKTESDLLLKGNMALPGGWSVLVGVKKITDNVDVSHFKAILSELKIMTYVSSIKRHANITHLFGAVTSEIKSRKFMMILEYFPYGTLHEILKTHKGSFVNLVKHGTISKDYAVRHYCNVQQATLSNLITTFALIRWSFEICNGLQYLSSIGVVHADICTQNIYLTEDKVAKLSVPALPVQLYRYSTYHKSEEIPLKWRWMSVESLKDMVFTTRSDVWSVGVTIYEIFTMAAVPFSGLSWTPDFVNYLTRGLRMNKPMFATDKIYKLLLECWDTESSRRPSPEQLCTFFDNILRQHNISNNYLTNITECVSDDNISTDSSCIATPLGSV